MKSRWTLPILTGILLAFGLASFQLQAQDYVYATGNPNFGVNYPIPGGYINVTNGNVHITIPLGTFKQRGNLPPVKVNLEYDSRIWKIIDNGGYSWQPVNVPNSMAGWRLTTGLEQGTTSFEEIPVTGPMVCDGKLIQTTVAEDYTRFTWTDGQGTQHIFDATLRQTVPPQGPCPPGGPYPPVSGSGYAIDGSGYYLQVVNDYVMTIYDNSGNEVYPVRKDPNGNTITVNSNGEPVDVQGHTLVTTTTNGNTIQYQVPTVGGGTNTFTATTEPLSVNTAFNQSAVSEYGGTLTGIQSIELPDGSTYSFTYDSGTNGNYGEMTSMTLPTGGNVSLYYSNYLDSYNNENRWISEENDNNGYTSFTPKVIPPDSKGNLQEQMTVSGAFAGSRVYTLTLNDGAWNGVTQTYAGAPQSSPLLLTVTNNYNFQSYQCSTSYICNGAEYITASSSTATLNDISPNLTATTCYTYAAPWIGKTSAIQEWDYSGSAVSCTSPPTPNRETDYAYNYVLNGASLVTQESKNFNGPVFSSTTYSYNNGNMTSKVEGISGGAQATTSYGYNSDGSRKSKTDPNGNVTSYAYACSDVFVSQTTYPTTGGVGHITGVNPDCYTGQPLTTTDQNGQVTTYKYDGYGRETSIVYPDGGLTSYSYPSATEMVESKLLSGSTSSTLTTTYDGYGRKSQTSQSDPAGDDIVTYAYAYPNLPGCVSAPYRGTTSNGSTCPSYDALDRPIQITQSDGNKIQVSYAGNQATVTDENGHQKRYVYDAFHDLTQVFEPNAAGTPSWETDYSYDAAGRVLSVTQKGDGSSAARVRTFGYDDLGRLTGESTPEAGTQSYGYDNNGNLKSKTDARNITTTYTYDELNRMTAKSGGGLNYVYLYDAVGGVPPLHNTIGRLVDASNDINADEIFSYDSMGRLNWQASWTPTSPNNTNIVTQATYDVGGDLTSLTYPDGRLISESYDSAQHLTGIQYASWNGQSVNASYYSATGFSPGGETTNTAFGNGVQMAASFNSRQSISALSYATASQTLWSKQYTWAANAKNLLQSADVVNPAQTYNYTYDPDNRLATASGGGQTLVSPATSGTGSFTFAGGPDGRSSYQVCGYVGRIYECQTFPVYNYGAITIQISTSTYSISYGINSTASSLASALTSAISGDSGSPVTATASGATVFLTSKATGTVSNYSISVTGDSYDSKYFSGPSFSASASGADMTGGANAVYSGVDVLNETYTVDPWGNQQESGNFNFQQSYNPANNQINGYSYDAAGDLLGDGMNTYTYDGEGMLTATNGAQYVYDALQQRVEKIGGSNPTEVIYFSGHPMALLNATSGAWTDLIWAGSNMLAEVAGNQAATPVYRLLDHEGSLVATTDGSGNVTGTNTLTPYGETLSSSTNDAYLYASLYQDTEYGGNDAWYRNYSTEQSRWLTPDPYNGSYDLMNPQSLNRYMYVNGNPLGFVDPSGQAGAGVLTGVGGNICTGLGGYFFGAGTIAGINPCSPVSSIVAIGIVNIAQDLSLYGSAGITIGDWSIGSGALGTSLTAGEVVPVIGAAFTIGCSFSSNSDLCGQSGWTSAVFTGDNKWAGTAINDGIALTGMVSGIEVASAASAEGISSASYLASCIAGPSNPVCDVAIALIAYTALNDLFSIFWNLFGGGPQFSGSLLPRPSDLGGLGTSPIGIPNQNMSLANIVKQ